MYIPDGSSGHILPEPGSEEERARFHELQRRLVPMVSTVFPDRMAERTVVVVPSLSLDTDQLHRIDEIVHYEERMLCLLMLLRMPRTRIVHMTSRPIPPNIVDYYLHLLPGIPSHHARNRLTLLSWIATEVCCQRMCSTSSSATVCTSIKRDNRGRCSTSSVPSRNTGNSEWRTSPERPKLHLYSTTVRSNLSVAPWLQADSKRPSGGATTTILRSMSTSGTIASTNGTSKSPDSVRTARRSCAAPNSRDSTTPIDPPD